MSEKEIKNQIQLQIEALRAVTNNAVKSKEAANDYLISAGIINEEKEGNFEQQNKEDWHITDQRT